MRLSAAGALRRKESAMKLGNFNQMYDKGTALDVYYALFWDEENQEWSLPVGAQWGYRIGMKELKLKTAFLPSKCTFDTSGNLVGEPDIAFQFSKVAQAIIDAEHQAEISEILAQGYDPVTQANMITEADKKYDPKSSLNAKGPVISRPMIQITTECVAVKAAVDGGARTPEEIRLVTQKLSNKLLSQLADLILKHQPEHEEGVDVTYIQLHYSYPNKETKAQASQNVTISCPGEFETIKHLQPNDYSLIAAKLSSISLDDEVINKRSTRDYSEQELLVALKQYCIKVLPSLQSLDATTDSGILEVFKNNAEFMRSIPGLATNVKASPFRDAIMPTGTSAPAVPTATTQTAPTVNSILGAAETAPVASAPVVESAPVAPVVETPTVVPSGKTTASAIAGLGDLIDNGDDEEISIEV